MLSRLAYHRVVTSQSKRHYARPAKVKEEVVKPKKIKTAAEAPPTKKEEPMIEIKSTGTSKKRTAPPKAQKIEAVVDTPAPAPANPLAGLSPDQLMAYLQSLPEESKQALTSMLGVQPVAPVAPAAPSPAATKASTPVKKVSKKRKKISEQRKAMMLSQLQARRNMVPGASDDYDEEDDYFLDPDLQEVVDKDSTPKKVEVQPIIPISATSAPNPKVNKKLIEKLVTEARAHAASGMTQEAFRCYDMALCEGPGNLNLYLEWAKVAEKVEDWGMAFNCFIEAQVLDPQNPHHLFKLCDIATEKAVTDRNLEYVHKLIMEFLQQNPGMPEGIFYLADILRQKRKFKESSALFSDLLDSIPRTRDMGELKYRTMRSYGVTLAARKKHKKALEVFKEALTMKPTDPVLLGLMGELQERGFENLDAAVPFYVRSFKAKQTVEICEKLATVFMNATWRGFNLVEARRYNAKAYELSEEYIYLFNVGWLSMQLRDWKEAEEALSKVRMSDTDQPRKYLATVLLAEIYANEDTYPTGLAEAIRLYENSLTFRDDPDARLSLAQCYTRNKQFDKAEECINQAKALDERNPTIFMVQLQLLTALNAPQNAIAQSAKEMIKKVPNSPYANYILGKYIAEVEGDQKTAIGFLMRSLKFSEKQMVKYGTVTGAPNFLPELYITLGKALLDSGDYLRAKTFLVKALEMKQHSGPLFYSLARAQLYADELPKAYKNIQLAAGLMPNYPKVQMMAAECAVRQGEITTGMNFLRRTMVALHPDQPNIGFADIDTSLTKNNSSSPNEPFSKFTVMNPGNLDTSFLDYGVAREKVEVQPTELEGWSEIEYTHRYYALLAHCFHLMSVTNYSSQRDKLLERSKEHAKQAEKYAMQLGRISRSTMPSVIQQQTSSAIELRRSGESDVRLTKKQVAALAKLEDQMGTEGVEEDAEPSEADMKQIREINTILSDQTEDPTAVIPGINGEMPEGMEDMEMSQFFPMLKNLKKKKKSKASKK